MRWKILSKELKNIQKKEQILDTLLKNRGFTTKKQREEFLNPSLDTLDQDMFDKKQLQKALVRVHQAIKQKEQIIVYSDYDVDGITGGAILWETLDGLGASVMPYVPRRMEEGYGMSKKGIDIILSDYPKTKLIITVDHGITTVDQVEYAREKGIDVIITDHHTIGVIVPNAFSVIHTTKLAGSGVAYVFSRKIDQKENSEHLALAAIGTVGDLVPLVGPNRVIAKFGLDALNKTKRTGLLSLFEVAGLLDKTIGTYEVGFLLAPRINASGRLTHALDALRLLCTRSPERARTLAKHLDTINLERQEMLIQTSEHAQTLVDKDQKLVLVAHESYHEGVIGLVAGKLVEAYYRPTIVVSKGQVLSKASARSITGFNIVEAIRTHSDLLVNVGGHPMAAGFTIETEKLSLFEEKLQKYVNEKLTENLLERELVIDTEIALNSLSLDLYDTIQQMAPFGVGNYEPLFVTKNVSVIDAGLVGANNQHLKMKVRQDSTILDVIGFGKGNMYESLSPDKTISIAYALSKNIWNNHEKLQLKLKDIAL